MKLIKTTKGQNKLKFTKQEWKNIGKEAGWYDTSEGPTDEGNEVGNWNGGWLNGEWKCPSCGTMIGKNLKNESPHALVAEHKQKCQ